MKYKLITLPQYFDFLIANNILGINLAHSELDDRLVSGKDLFPCDKDPLSFDFENILMKSNFTLKSRGSVVYNRRKLL